MRLTLRTLLAYLDDILPPAQAKEIGQKITESTYASNLVDRIRDVMRRRRLTAPELDGDGEVATFDANAVAEYLDNTLPPDMVADVEKVCLESDIHLAEVAACHQILTLVLGEPVEIRQKSRERMYALAPWGNADFAVPTNSAKAATELAVAPAAVKTAPRQALASTIPEYMQREPIWRRARMPIMFLTCVGLWLLLLWVDPTYNPLFVLWPDQSAAPTATAVADNAQGSQPAPAGEAANQNAGAQTPDAETATSSPAAEPGESVASTDVEPSAASLEETPIDPPPPADEPEADATPIVDAQQPVSSGEPSAVAGDDTTPVEAPTEVAVIGNPPLDPETTPVESTNAAPTPQPEPPAQEAAKIQYNSQNGILLRFDPQVADWVVLPHRSLVHPSEQIASPEPFEGVLDVGTALCRVTLLGGTSIVSRPPTSKVSLGFDVKRGRLVIEGRSAAGGEGAMILAVGVGERLWHLELVSPETRCGLEVLPRFPNQFEQELTGDLVQANLYLLSGSVRVADDVQLQAVMDGPSQVSLAPLGNAPQAALTVQPLSGKLNWLDAAGRQLSRTNLRYASLFENEFEFDKGVSLIVPALVKSANPRMSQYAAACLALTENVNGLVSALAPAAHEESRRAAIEGLRTWLPRAPGNRDVLHAELARTFTEDDAAVVYRLLWGYNLDDARNAQASAQLVDWLDHEHIAVRELAFLHILELTGGRRYDYRPLAPAAQQKAAIGRWREHLEREGALVQ